MLTGRSPYPMADRTRSTGAVRWVAPTPVLTVDGLPRPVAEICRQCMAKRPADRPDAAAVALDLWALIVPPPAPPEEPPSALELPAAPAPPPERTHSDQVSRSTFNMTPRQGRRSTGRPAWLGPTSGHPVVTGSR
jgi:hypothetical protein